MTNENNEFENVNTNEENEANERKEKIIEEGVNVEDFAVMEEETTAELPIFEIREESREEQPKKKSGSPFVAGLLGAVIGSAAMFGGIFATMQMTGTPIGNRVTTTTQEVTVTNISSEDVTGIIGEAQKSVVGVVNMQRAGGSSLESLFGEGRLAEGTGELQPVGSGSGIVYRKDGDTAYIVTNHHVIEDADAVEITLADGTKLEATVVGSDAWSDLAVLQVDGNKIEHVATLGDSDVLLAGQSVIAIGNPLGFLDSTVTQGIVSNAERSIDVDINNDGTQDWEMSVIQTDAAINPGNSGGALLNANGEVIGINSSKIADATVEGIGFAIPITSAIPILEQLETTGTVSRPQMGVSLVDLSLVSAANRSAVLKLPNDVTAGVVVAEVSQGTPAAEAGLQVYDVMIEINGHRVESTVDVRRYLFNETKIGDEVTVTFYREGQRQTAKLVLTEQQNN